MQPLYYLALNHSKLESLVESFLWEKAFTPTERTKLSSDWLQTTSKALVQSTLDGRKRRKKCGRWEEDCQPALGYPFHSWPLGDKPMRFFRAPLNSSWLMLAERPCLWNLQVTQRLWGKPPETPRDVCDWINNLSVKPLRLLMGCPWVDCQGVYICWVWAHLGQWCCQILY